MFALRIQGASCAGTTTSHAEMSSPYVYDESTHCRSALGGAEDGCRLVESGGRARGEKESAHLVRAVYERDGYNRTFRLARHRLFIRPSTVAFRWIIVWEFYDNAKMFGLVVFIASYLYFFCTIYYLFA